VSTTSRGNTRILLALCFCTTSGAFNFLAMTPFYPDVSSDLDVSVSVLGQIVTFMVLLSGVLGLVLGPLVDAPCWSEFPAWQRISSGPDWRLRSPFSSV
jgi:predicted MFS family arabinose efflux permease